jgi:GH35 family endo-1,4-beta-xylanase
MFVKRFYTCLFLTVVLLVSSSYADWKSDANARIESMRKRNAQITVLGSNGQPVSDVNVQIKQVKHQFGFGTAIPYGLLNSNANYRTFVLNHFEWAVCENAMKWDACESTRDVETYTQADFIADWCADNNIKLRGHNLVWETGSQTPSWVSPLPCATYPTGSEMLTEIDERINSIVGRYAGQIVSWDVDNEMLSGNMFDCLGEEGRAHFFQLGNSIDPDCGFYMNEYSGNSFNNYDGDAYRNRAQGLINLKAPVEGLGIQAHINTPFQPENYYNNVLNELDDLGLPIIATEFDTDATNATAVADDLENFYRLCFSHPSVEGIIMWGCEQSSWRWDGIVDSSTWVHNEAGVRYDALMAAWTTKDANYTNASGNVNFRGFHGTYEITLSKVGEPNTEIHTIEIEPGTGTEEFVLNTGFYSGPPETNAPTPNPMTWASVPAATGPYSITMTATTASDNSPPVRYYFECTNHGEANSTWQTSPTYTVSGLTPSTLYTFRVKARDSSPAQNQTGWSSTQSATTDPPDTVPPTPTPMTWASVPTATGASTITMTANTATDTTSPPVQYYFECTNHGEANSAWQSSPTYIAGSLTPLTSYSFRVKARDSAPSLNETGWSSTLSATTDAPPTDINIVGSWGTGTTHAKENGYSRALILITHAEHANSISLNSVTYGGQTMTKVIERTTGGTGYQAYVAAFILKEPNIAVASSGTFTPSWSATPENVSYVNQTTSIGATASASSTSSTPNPITTSALATNDGDIVIDAAACGNAGDYTLLNGFTEALEHDMSSSTGVDGYKFATGANETPSAQHSSVNRQAIIGFVVKAGAQVDLPPAAPTNLTATPGNGTVTLNWNDNNEIDLAGYNIYRSTTSGSGYSKLNVSLLSSSNYVDNTVTNGIPYFYVAAAVDEASNLSGYSNEASATPDYQDCNDVQDANLGLLSDLNGDCYVNYKDLDIIAGYWLNTDCASYANCDGADFSPTDGTVDFADFSKLAEQWMQCNDPIDAGCFKNWAPPE